ncbi:lysine--tRNA ligase, partial [Francisella tularensis subsp. holarctica]|nr:lysine--tRNA ligase [Francisella tularensis subsp. holarctica]
NGISHPTSFRRNDFAIELQSRYTYQTKTELEDLDNKQQYSLTCRVVLRRVLVNAYFITLQHFTCRIQVYLKMSDLPDG